jgi:ribonuclease VapC
VIVVDTSALMAVMLDEPGADACSDVLEGAETILISAATLAEALIVASHRGLATDMQALIDRLGCQIVPVTEADAAKVANAHTRWGRGVHPAGLNFGDCFAYALARERNCELLFVGNDFSRTDIATALSRQA